MKSIPGLLKSLTIRALATLPGGIGSLESILGLLKSLKIQAQHFTTTYKISTAKRVQTVITLGSAGITRIPYI